VRLGVLLLIKQVVFCVHAVDYNDVLKFIQKSFIKIQVGKESFCERPMGNAKISIDGLGKRTYVKVWLMMAPQRREGQEHLAPSYAMVY